MRGVVLPSDCVLIGNLKLQRCSARNEGDLLKGWTDTRRMSEGELGKGALEAPATSHNKVARLNMVRGRSSMIGSRGEMIDGVNTHYA